MSNDDRNKGRIEARINVLTSIRTMRNAAQSRCYGDEKEYFESMVAGYDAALQLIEQTDPLELWEADIRKGHKQWGKTSPRYLRVLLDGEPVKWAVAADRPLGLVMAVCKDDNGLPVHAGDGVQHEILEGEVTFERR
jgi:hypothetical protein